MNEKETEEKRLARERRYQVLREKGRFHGIPKRAPSSWRDVLEATSGRGIQPYKNPFGGWLEIEEFKDHVPILLRNYKAGFAPDLVAQLCGLETDRELFEALESSRVPQKSEADYYADLAYSQE